MTQRKPGLFAFFLLWIVLSACASSPSLKQADITSTPSSARITSTSPSVVSVTPAEVIQTQAPKLIPKQNDLIFIEFFAVT